MLIVIQYAEKQGAPRWALLDMQGKTLVLKAPSLDSILSRARDMGHEKVYVSCRSDPLIVSTLDGRVIG